MDAPTLPDGLFRDADGTYRWHYQLDMYANPAPLLAGLRVLVAVCAGTGLMMVVIFALSFSLGLLMALAVFLASSVGLGGLGALVGWLVWLAMRKSRGGVYVYEFQMTEDAVTAMQVPADAARTTNLATAAFVLGAASGEMGAAAIGAGALGSTRVDSPYRSVRALVADRQHDLIRVNHLLLRNSVFATPEQYDFVWDYLATRCPHARVRA